MSLPGWRRVAGTGVMSRRAALSLGGLALIGVLAWASSNVLDAMAGRLRRFTGSRWLPPGGVPPATTFFGEGTDPIDAETWQLAVRGRVAHPLDLSLLDL